LTDVGKSVLNVKHVKEITQYKIRRIRSSYTVGDHKQ